MYPKIHKTHDKAKVEDRGFSIKLTWMLKILVVWGSKDQRKRATLGPNLYENLCIPNSTKSMERVKSPTKILKTNFDVENVDGFGVKTTKKEGNLG